MTAPSILACTICGYHSPDGPNDAAGFSIFFLLIVILCILGAVVFFMARMMRREREHLDPALQDDYVRPSSSSIR